MLICIFFFSFFFFKAFFWFTCLSLNDSTTGLSSLNAILEPFSRDRVKDMTSDPVVVFSVEFWPSTLLEIALWSILNTIDVALTAEKRNGKTFYNIPFLTLKIFVLGPVQYNWWVICACVNQTQTIIVYNFVSI